MATFRQYTKWRVKSCQCTLMMIRRLDNLIRFVTKLNIETDADHLMWDQHLMTASSKTGAVFTSRVQSRRVWEDRIRWSGTGAAWVSVGGHSLVREIIHSSSLARWWGYPHSSMSSLPSSSTSGSRLDSSKSKSLVCQWSTCYKSISCQARWVWYRRRNRTL